ncbi:MAG: ABC transporter ATP-binding protein/permease [Chloroflexi bacterium]|nr:ABC transporter ATP-binding protein/permease [Chloroflexota bacterium]
MNYLLRIFGYVRPYTTIAGGVIATIVILAGTNLLPAWVQKLIIDGLTRHTQLRALLGLAAFYFLVVAVNAGLNALQANLVQVLGQHIIEDLRNEIFRAIQRQGMPFFDRYETGQLMSRVTSDVNLIQLFVNSTLVNLIGSILTPFFALIILFRLDVALTLWVLLTIPPIVVLQSRLARIRLIWREIQRRVGDMNVVLQESLVAIKLVKAFNRLKAEAERFNASNWQIRQERLWAQRQSIILGQLQNLCTNLGMVIVLTVGAQQVIVHAISLGTLVAFQRYISLLFLPFQRVAAINQTTQMAMVAAERVFEVLDAPIAVQDPQPPVAPSPQRGEVVFEHVTFGYVAGRPVLHDISLKIPAGETLAIIGASGSGKSSLVHLVPRFYDPQKGRVLIDDHNVREYPLKDLRRCIGMVMQETFLFNLSIRDNIRYGRPDASNEEVERAARIADAYRFITEDLPEGFDTIIGEKGVRLSGGQRQRLAIARAICTDPLILILDEATSSVDTRTDAAIQRALRNVLRDRTTIVIAHRLSTVQQAHQIVMLHRGQIVARGTHEELLQTSREYRLLNDLQSSRTDLADAAIAQLMAMLEDGANRHVPELVVRQ